jgi:hypothetical protein
MDDQLLFQRWEQVTDVADFLVVENGTNGLSRIADCFSGVVDEVRPQVAAVKLHAFNHVELGLDLPSSTVMTPSLPTLSMASAMILPMVSSLLAEIEPTWRFL